MYAAPAVPDFGSWRERAPVGLRGRATTYAWLLVAVAILAPVIGAWVEGARAGFYWPVWGQDADLYFAAARRWVGGGGFYPPSELAGPFEVLNQPTGAQPILYTPTALLLLLPFAFLPIWVWTGAPLILTAILVASHH